MGSRVRGVVLALLVSCTGDGGDERKDDDKGDDDDAPACSIQEGTWMLEMALVAGSDPLCPDVPPDTVQVDDDDSYDCDPGCTCSLVEDPDQCTGVLSESCADEDTETTVDCTLSLDGPAEMSGDCEIVVHVVAYDLTVTCQYTFGGQYQG